MVSVITAAYNCAAFIEQTILSVQCQTHELWEMIIIDDNSTDDTAAIVKRVAEADGRIKFLQNHQNLGVAKTRNRGIEQAQGRYLAFLDGDDMWLPDFLSISVSYMKKHSYHFIFSSYQRLNENLQPFRKDFIVPKRVSYKSLLRTCPISSLTAVINIERLGKFYMPDIPKRQDYGFWLDVLKQVKYAYGIQLPLAIKRVRKKSVPRDNRYQAMLYVWKVYREIEKLNVAYSAYLMFNYTIYGIFRHAL